MEENETKLVSIKDTSDARWLTVKGINTIHQIGLGQDGCLKSYLLYKDDSDDDDSDGENKEDSICVSLFQISICDTGGVMIAPTNKDLKGTVNGEELVSEINLISGSIMMIADKKLKIVDGPPYKERKKLPPTPGVVHPAAPPPKPHRNTQDGGEYVQPSANADEKELSDWYLVHSPMIDVEIIHSLETPEKLGNMAASFLSRQIHLYTDSKLSISATDEIFKFLQNVAFHQRNLLLTYLIEMSKNYEEMPEAERDRPVHSPAIRLLVEILRQILDPLSHVVLCLQMIRTFSHFPKNLIEIVQCKATPAILGCMAVYKDVEEVQEYGLDILAKIATYKNQLNEKLPIRETGVEMILRTMEHHRSNAVIVQPGCRTLTRLTSNIEETLHQMLDTEYQFCSEIEEAIETYEILLKHIFEQAIPAVQDALQQFPKNLSVSKEGRHFLYNSSKMSALMTKKKNRLLKSFSEKEESTGDESDSIYMPMADVFKTVETKDNTKGILKKSDSFEIVEDSNLYQERKVRFVDDDNPDSYTSSDANSSDSDGERNIEPVLEIQETRILHNTDHLLSPPLPLPENLNDSFERMFISNQGYVSKVEESENSIDNLFTSVCNGLKGDSLTTDLEYEVMNSSLEESTDMPHRHHCVENIYETFDFVKGGDNSSSNYTEDVKQEVLSHTHIENSVSSSQPDVCENDDKDCHSGNVVEHSNHQDEVGEHSSHQDEGVDNQFTVADVLFLTKVVHVQVVRYISSLVIDEDNKRALKEIDQPIISLLQSSEAPQGLIEFVKREINKEKTMMDLEPSLVIKIIDAVNYRSVLHELLQSTLINVISSLHAVKNRQVLSIAVSCITSVFTQENLQVLIMDDSYLTTVRSHLDPCISTLENIPEFSLLTQKIYKDDMISSNLVKLSL